MRAAGRRHDRRIGHDAREVVVDVLFEGVQVIEGAIPDDVAVGEYGHRRVHAALPGIGYSSSGKTPGHDGQGRASHNAASQQTLAHGQLL